MRRSSFFLLLISILLIFGGITAILFSRFAVVYVKEFDMVGLVNDSAFGLGFNGTQLLFGMVTPGSRGIRSIKLANNQSERFRFVLKLEGNISPYVIVPENPFYLMPAEQRILNLSFAPPPGTPYGRYTGRLRVIVKRAKPFYISSPTG